jgi:hypothetical protein
MKIKTMKKVMSENEESNVDTENDETDIQSEDEENEQRYDLRSRRNISMHSKYQDYVTETDEVMLTHSECMNDKNKENWKKAIKEEKDSINKNETWEYVDRDQAKGKKILTNRWIFKEKDEGCFKARPVVRGCQQRAEEVKFRDTFSPTVDINSLRVLFAIAAQNNLNVQMFDVKTAFLFGELKEKVYMEIPEGYKNKKNKISLLKKALYGLKQAPFRWNKKLTTYLKEQGLTQIKSNQCIFNNNSNSMYIAIQVDDGIIFGEDKRKIEKVLNGLQKSFEISKTENPTMYLGMEIKISTEGIWISQENYAKKALEKFNMQNCKDSPTPLVTKPSTEPREENESRFPHQEAVGSLLHLSTKTRPDLAYATKSCQIQNVKRTLK